MPPPAVSDNPAGRVIQDYTCFLFDQRGLRQAPVGNYVPVARRFLESRFGVGKLSLNKLSVIDVTDFIVHGSPKDSPKRVQLNASALRSFLGFLTQRGEVTANLAAAVPTVANWRLAEL